MSFATQETLESLQTEEGQQKLTEMARSGKTMKEIADALGITRATLYAWSKKYPEIQHALSEGKRVADDRVEQSLYDSCFGHTEKEVTIERDGNDNIIKTIVRSKYVPPNVTAIQYWLQNRCNDKWKAKQQLEITGDTKLPIMFVNNIPNPYAKDEDDESKDV